MSASFDPNAELVDYTGKSKPGKRGVPPALRKLGIDGDYWTDHVKGFRTAYQRFVGVQAMAEKAKALNQQWLKGIGYARRACRQPVSKTHRAFLTPLASGALAVLFPPALARHAPESACCHDWPRRYALQAALGKGFAHGD